MKSILAICSLFVFAASTMVAAKQTWTGKISDSMCGAKHNTSEEHGREKNVRPGLHPGLHQRPQREICVRPRRKSLQHRQQDLRLYRSTLATLSV